MRSEIRLGILIIISSATASCPKTNQTRTKKGSTRVRYSTYFAHRRIQVINRSFGCFVQPEPLTEHHPFGRLY